MPSGHTGLPLALAGATERVPGGGASADGMGKGVTLRRLAPLLGELVEVADGLHIVIPVRPRSAEDVVLHADTERVIECPRRHIDVIVRLARKLYSLPWAIALGLLLGGALGNLTDRVFRAPGVFQGEVVDFIAPKGFAVFNLADSAIVCGGILIVLLSFRGLDPDGTVHKD